MVHKHYRYSHLSMSRPQREHTRPSSYFVSPDSRVNSPLDETYLPSLDVWPLDSIAPYSSPARNILRGEGISQKIKDEIKARAPN